MCAPGSLPSNARGGARCPPSEIPLPLVTSPLHNGHLSSRCPVPVTREHDLTSWAKVATLAGRAPVPPKAPARPASAQPGARARGLRVGKTRAPDHYLLSSGSDPHSTLLGFCSIHFNPIQDALQHAKRLGGRNGPPPLAHPPTAHPLPPRPRAQHPWCPPQHVAFRTMPCAPSGVGGERGPGVAGGSVGGEAGSVGGGVLGWGSSFGVLSCRGPCRERREEG